MSSFSDTLLKISQELPKSSDVNDVEDINDVILTLEEVLGYSERIWNIENDVTDQLSADQRNLFETLKHIQCIWYLLSDITYDGLFSIFYNDTGDEIDGLRKALKDSDVELSKLFEKAYSLVALPLDIIATDNFVVRNQDKDPSSVIEQEALDQLEKIEEQIEEIREVTFDNAIARYQAALA